MGPHAQVCSVCGEEGRFRGDVCRPCRRRGLTDESDFTENTVRTSLLLNNGWMVGNAWRLLYVGAGIGSLWLGRMIEIHTEYMAVPMGLLVISMGNEVLLNRRHYIPRAFQRLSATTLRIGMHAQMVAFMMVMGIGTGHAAVRMGYDPYLRNPLNVLETAEAVRSREAADDFPQRIPLINKELAIVDGLIEKSNLGMAEERLRDIDGQMDPVLRSYAKDFADVIAMKKLVTDMHERLNAHRQTLAVNQAMSRMDAVNRRLEQIDNELARNRWDLASHLWVKAQREIDDLLNPANALSHDIEASKAHLEKQRDMIRRGFAHLPMPAGTPVAKRETREAPKKHRNAGSHEMASVDP